MNGLQRRVFLPSLDSPLVNQMPFRQPPSVSAQAHRPESGVWIIDFIGPSSLRWTLSPPDALSTANAFIQAVQDSLLLG